MNRQNNINLLKKATGLVGAAAIASLAGLPALAQVNPRPGILNEPAYDGNPGGTATTPAATPSLEGVNPRPSIFNEPRYDGVQTEAAPAVPATTSLEGTNPNPSVLNEPRYDGVQGGTSQSPMMAPGMMMTPGGTSQSPMMAPNAASQAAVSPLDREFMVMAAHSDQFEIQSSQLALQKTTNPQVREYAQMMIQQHTQSSQLLAQIAAERGVTLPTAPAPFDQAVIEQLAQLSGAEFDRAYMEAQANGHLKTTTIYQTEIGQGQDQEVRAFAAQLLPAVQQHFQVASSMVPNYAIDIRRPVQ